MSPDPIDSDESNDFHSGSATGSSYPVVPQRCTWACLKMEDGSWWTPQLWLFDTLWMGKHDEKSNGFFGLHDFQPRRHFCFNLHGVVRTIPGGRPQHDLSQFCQFLNLRVFPFGLTTICPSLKFPKQSRPTTKPSFLSVSRKRSSLTC